LSKINIYVIEVWSSHEGNELYVETSLEDAHKEGKAEVERLNKEYGSEEDDNDAGYEVFTFELNATITLS
tara:strand:+ start:1257 stop:1466 length:210 start_codon:yes stop_codon:yes gene_type:complete